MSYNSNQVEYLKKRNTADSATEFYHKEGVDDSELKKDS